MTIARDLTVAVIEKSKQPFPISANAEKATDSEVGKVVDLFNGIASKLDETYDQLRVKRE